MSGGVVAPIRPGGPRHRASSRALVLNVTYEPISVVSQRRALILVLADKAEMLHPADGVIRTASTTHQVPSVVRLRYHVKVPFRRRAPLNRRAIFARDGNACVYCGHAAECIDHVVPRSRGGPHEWENVVASCRSCNLRKSDKYLRDTPFRLTRPPMAPPALSWVALAVSKVPTEWTPYLPDDVPIPA